MRKITEQAINAFNNNSPFSSANTVVNVCDKETSLLLHGNLIAIKDAQGLQVTTAGWPTNTTKERLNGLQGVQVNTRKGQLYLNGEEWSGELTRV